MERHIPVGAVFSPTGEIEEFRPLTPGDSVRLEEFTGETIQPINNPTEGFQIQNQSGNMMLSEEADDSIEPESTDESNGTQVTPATLPVDPDDLLDQGYNETTHPNAAANGHRTFVNPETGEEVRFDEGEEGQTGAAASDHYHVLNPNRTGNQDLYLDIDGNPVARGSRASHIFVDE